MAVTSTGRAYTIYSTRNNNIALKCVQGERNIRLAQFTLRDSNSVIDLSDAIAVLYSGVKSDYSPCWIECSITNAVEGVIQLNQYSGMSDVPGIVNGKIIVIAANGNIQFDGINLVVAKNPSLAKLSDSDAFQALENALNKIAIITPSGTITIDDELSTSSVDAVQNRVITTAINSILVNKIDKISAIKYVSTEDISDCTDSDTIYRVSNNGEYNTLICSFSENSRAQYLLQADGKIKMRVSEKSNGAWGNWTDWKSFAMEGTLLSDYGITDAYTKTEIDTSLSAINQDIDNLIQVVSELPQTGDPDINYILNTNGKLTYYKWVNNTWQIVNGDTYTKTETDTLLGAISEDIEDLSDTVDTKASQSDLNALSATVDTKASQASVTSLAETVATKASQAEVTSLSNTVSGKASQTSVTNLTNALESLVTTGAVKEIEAVDGGIVVTYWDDDEITIPIQAGGLAFDSGYVDSEGYLHLALEGVDIEGFTPFFVGSGGGGGGGSSITLSNVIKPTSIRNGADAYYSFVASATDDTNVSVVWFVDGTQVSSTQDKPSGYTFIFNARDYLRPSDTSTVKAVITSESGATLNRQWSVTSAAHSIAWGSAINPVMLYTSYDDVYVVVSVSTVARSENLVTVSLGQHSIEKRVVGSKNETFVLDKSWFASGVNTINATMVSASDSEDAATPISFMAIWQYGKHTPTVAFADSTLDVTQYDVAHIKYFVYDPANETANCTIQVGSETPRSLTAGRTLQTFDYIPQESGNITLTLTCGNQSTTMTLSVDESPYDIGKVTGDNLVYEVDPVGHSNTDADRASFGGFTFSQNFDWVNGGFHTDSANGAVAFVVKKGDRVTLPRAIFSDADSNGKTIDVSFKIKNSDLYDAVAMQELNNGESKGLILRANEGELRLNNTNGQLFRYCEDSRIDMSVNVESVNDRRIMTVWLDGVQSLANPYSANTLVQNESNLVIGSDHCDVWIYAIRVYNTSLSLQEMIQNYISLGSTTSEKIIRCIENDVFDDNGVITPETLHSARPDLTIVHISADRMTTNKKDPVDATVTIRDGSDVLTLDSNTNFKVQGTSSAAYGRAAYNLDVDFKKSGKTYKLSANAIPVNYINIKVNVASSENANNICAVDMYNQYQPYLVPARARPGVRDTVEGKPCAVFFTNTSNNTIWIGSQQLYPGDTVLYAMGDICNSKKNLEVFGQDGEGEHYCKGCIEVSGNDTAAQQFRATSTYNAEDGEWQTVNGGTVSKDFEWRQEPKPEDLDEVVAAWNAAVAWVVSTIGDSAKFKAEVGNYFAINSLLYHFLCLEFFAAFDNVSKNTFYSYTWDETAQRYLFSIVAAYDWDTILGCDNDGLPLADYGADFGDTAGSRSLFNADNNTIWVNIQESCFPELSAMYVERKGKGAFSASAVKSKWANYQNIRPRAAMAQDAYNKYVLPYKTTGVVVGSETKGYDDSYLPRLQGLKTYQREQFVTYEEKYMDGKDGYYSTSQSIAFRANAPLGTTKNLSIKAYTKTYVTLIVDNGTKVAKKIGKGQTEIFENVSVHSNATIYVTPESLIESITPLEEINNSTFSASGATKLQDVTLGSASAANTAWNANTGLNVPSPILKTLSIRNLTNFAQSLDLSANVELESVDTRGTKAGIITLPSYAPLESVYLNDCSGVVAHNLLGVERFSLTNGNNLIAVKVENCNSVVNNAILTYLGQAVASGGSATRRIRMTDVAWDLDVADLLVEIAEKWKGYDSLGNEIDTPIITGTCHVAGITNEELATIRTAFPQLTVTYDDIVPSYTVTFVNYDGTTLNTQIVHEGRTAKDPVTSGMISTPQKPSTVDKTYEYSGWDVDVSVTQITENLEVTAQYTETDRYYRVTWYANETDEIYHEDIIARGSTVFDSDTYSEPTPQGDDIWTGWSAEPSSVVSDMNIYATFVTPILPFQVARGHDYLYSDDPNDDSAYTFAEFCGILKYGNVKDYFNSHDLIKMVTPTDAFVDDCFVLKLAGFNHYKLADGSDNFANTAFNTIGVTNETHKMNTSITNTTSWRDSAVRAYLSTTFYDALPRRWKSITKLVNVLTSEGGTSRNIITTQDKIFLMSGVDVGYGTGSVPYKDEVDTDAETQSLEIFSDDDSRKKKRYNGEGDSNERYLLRSPYSNDSRFFLTVSASGTVAYLNPNNGTAYISFVICF